MNNVGTCPNSGSGIRILLAMLLCVTMLQQQSKAVILQGSSDPAQNTAAPTGEWAGSGWELQGMWGSFLGTPIGTKYFITAKHVGGQIGQAFTLQSTEYKTMARFDDPESDLVIWKISAIFPVYARLYSSTDETGRNVVVFGRGGPKGQPVQIASLLGQQEKGWLWNRPDEVLRWGVNNVTTTVSGNGGQLQILSGTHGGNGELLKMEFNSGAGPNEAHLSLGDSGGGLFIKQGTEWKLAGINYAVDGPYNTSPSGAGFSAAIYDEGGLYKGGEGRWQLVPDLPSNQAGGFYATRISSRLNWIESILNQPEPENPNPELEFTPSLPGGFVKDTNAAVDATSQTIRTSLPSASRFYRLRGQSPLRIKSVKVENGELLFYFE